MRYRVTGVNTSPLPTRPETQAGRQGAGRALRAGTGRSGHDHDYFSIYGSRGRIWHSNALSRQRYTKRSYGFSKRKPSAQVNLRVGCGGDHVGYLKSATRWPLQRGGRGSYHGQRVQRSGPYSRQLLETQVEVARGLISERNMRSLWLV